MLRVNKLFGVNLSGSFVQFVCVCVCFAFIASTHEKKTVFRVLEVKERKREVNAGAEK